VVGNMAGFTERLDEIGGGVTIVFDKEDAHGADCAGGTLHLTRCGGQPGEEGRPPLFFEHGEDQPRSTGTAT
jgi:hypothetical protein